MMKTKVILIITIVLLSFGLVQAQEFAKVGTSGAQFLKIAVGARGIGMAEAFDAVCSDASSIFWNPAGLTNIDKNSLMVAHANWLADINYEAAAYARNFRGIGVIGVSFGYLGSGDIEETTVMQQDGTGNFFSASNLTMGVSYARSLTDKFSIGGNIKYVEEKLENEKATAWAVDIGTVYKTGFRSLRMGISIRNFGPELKFSGTYQDYDNGSWVIDDRTGEPEQKEYLPYHMPMTFKVSLAYDLLEQENNFLTIASDLVHPNDNVERLNLGIEWRLYKILALRTGYIGPLGILGRYSDEVEDESTADEVAYETSNYAQNFSAGVGFNLDLKGFGTVNIDYAYTDYGVLDWVHRASMSINF